MEREIYVKVIFFFWPKQLHQPKVLLFCEVIFNGLTSH